MRLPLFIGVAITLAGCPWPGDPTTQDYDVCEQVDECIISDTDPDVAVCAKEPGGSQHICTAKCGTLGGENTDDGKNFKDHPTCSDVGEGGVCYVADGSQAPECVDNDNATACPSQDGICIPEPFTEG